jgi:hypothetical protein
LTVSLKKENFVIFSIPFCTSRRQSLRHNSPKPIQSTTPMCAFSMIYVFSKQEFSLSPVIVVSVHSSLISNRKVHTYVTIIQWFRKNATACHIEIYTITFFGFVIVLPPKSRFHFTLFFSLFLFLAFSFTSVLLPRCCLCNDSIMVLNNGANY